MVISIGLCVQADYTFQTYQPTYQSQPINYSAFQPYNQQYSETYSQNPYQSQCQGQYINPYQYQRPYIYGNNLPSTLVNSAMMGQGNTGVPRQIVKNIGQSLIYSMMRGY